MVKSTAKSGTWENDFWDVDERPISISNMEAELGRLKSGDKINLLNVGFDELQILFQGLNMYKGGLESKIDKMHDEILDAIRQINNPPAYTTYNTGSSTTLPYTLGANP